MLTIFYSVVHDLTSPVRDLYTRRQVHSGRGPGTKLAEDFYPPAGLIKFVVNNVMMACKHFWHQQCYISHVPAASQAEEAATEVPWLKVTTKTEETTWPILQI